MGIVEAVEASASGATLDLYLTPNDPEHLEELKTRAAASDRIVVHDPVPYSELIETLNAFDVGVHILPPVSFNNAWALPNKFFDYVQARLGLIIGPSHEMARLLNEYGCGVVADDFSSDALAAVLDNLTPEQVRGFKQSSDAAAHDLSAESQVAIWGAAIARLVQTDASPA
ncbi:hypothetical protein ASC63_00525 [Leifsonia sp. Root112D2]|nr:hypothetical protein ASC63_00525 [Leifsonia sp. Root112D2]